MSLLAYPTILKALSALLTFTVSLLLARVLSIQEFGVYVFCVSLAYIIAIPVRLGLPQLVLREVSSALELKKPAEAIGVILWSTFIALGASVCLVILYVAITWFANIGDVGNKYGKSVALVPVLALLSIADASLRGIARVNLSLFVCNVANHIIFIALILYASQSQQTSAGSMLEYLIFSNLSVLLIAVSIVFFLLGRYQWKNNDLFKKKKEWQVSVIPLALSGGVQQIIKRSDLVMLGILGSTVAYVGAYKVSAQVAILSVFFLQVLGTIFAQKLAAAYAGADERLLKRHLEFTAKASFASTILISSVFVTFGNEIIVLLFGAEYVVAYTPLTILLLGYVSSSFFGLVDVALNMSKAEMGALKGVICGLIVNIFLNFLLIPFYGATGAAAATAMSLFLTRFVQFIVLVRERGLVSAALIVK